MTTTTVIEMRTWLVRLLEARAFRPVYQPIVCLRTGEVVGYEALTRFDDGRSPEDVFALARRVGMSAVLEEATALEALRGAEGLPTGWVSINLSAPTLGSSETLRAAIGRSGRPVMIELTEHEPVEDPAAFAQTVAGLGSHVRIAIDDLGAGFAGLRLLLDLRPHILKLDRNLIDGIALDTVRQALVAGLAATARAFGGEVVAEGIEHEDQAACLHGLGVELGQGWALARPLPCALLAA